MKIKPDCSKRLSLHAYPPGGSVNFIRFDCVDRFVYEPGASFVVLYGGSEVNRSVIGLIPVTWTIRIDRQE